MYTGEVESSSSYEGEEDESDVSEVEEEEFSKYDPSSQVKKGIYNFHQASIENQTLSEDQTYGQGGQTSQPTSDTKYSPYKPSQGSGGNAMEIAQSFLNHSPLISHLN